MSRKSKHPLSTGHAHREPSSMIKTADLFAVCQNQCAKYDLTNWYEKCRTTYSSMKVCNFELDHCNGNGNKFHLQNADIKRYLYRPVDRICMNLYHDMRKKKTITARGKNNFFIAE
jgi:hypothetical protein